MAILMTAVLKALCSTTVSASHLRQTPRGGTLIFSHIRRLGPFFWVQNSEFQYFLGVFRKMNIFWGYKDFVDIFGGSSQNWASLRVISMQFRVFYKGQGK